MKYICLGSLPSYTRSGQVAVIALLLITGHQTSADPTISETLSSPESASSPLSPSSLSSSSRQKRAPGWGKRNGLEERNDVDLENDAGYQVLDDNYMTEKRAPGWGKRAPGWGKRAPGLGKRAPGWGKRSLDADSLLDDDGVEKRAPGWGKRAPGWGKRAPGWGKRAPGWGKRSLDEASLLEDNNAGSGPLSLKRGYACPSCSKRPGTLWGKRSWSDSTRSKSIWSPTFKRTPVKDKRSLSDSSRSNNDWSRMDKRAPGWGKRGWSNSSTFREAFRPIVKRAPGWTWNTLGISLLPENTKQVDDCQKLNDIFAKVMDGRCECPGGTQPACCIQVSSYFARGLYPHGTLFCSNGETTYVAPTCLKQCHK